MVVYESSSPRPSRRITLLVLRRFEQFLDQFERRQRPGEVRLSMEVIMCSRSSTRLSIMLAWAVLIPSVAHAQASINGTVTDTSGAVLPGVTVEASSPALIEKVRSVVSDATGQY